MKQNEDISEQVSGVIFLVVLVISITIAFIYKKEIGAFFERSKYIQFSIASDPSGANIVLDGNDIGITPVTLEIMFGQHTIEFKKLHFQTKSVAFRAGYRSKFDETAVRELNVLLHKIDNSESETISVNNDIAESLDKNIQKSSININNSTISIGNKNEYKNNQNNKNVTINPTKEENNITKISIGIFVSVVGGLVLWFLINKIITNKNNKV